MSDPRNTRRAVSRDYTRAISVKRASSSCCGPLPAKGLAASLAGYSRQELASLPADAVTNSFGCGNPVALAAIREGDTVLDLGSGAGIDILLAAKLVGPAGRVIGVDMTPAMLQRARTNITAAGLTNVEVRQGIIENLPIDDGSIDLVISNCVINLSPEKPRVFAEIARVLRAGGRISVSDIVAAPMPDWLKSMSGLYSSCLTGAIPETDYLAGLGQAGLVEVAVADRMVYQREQLAALVDSDSEGCCCGGPSQLSKDDLAKVMDALAGKVASVRVVARKP